MSDKLNLRLQLILPMSYQENENNKMLQHFINFCNDSGLMIFRGVSKAYQNHHQGLCAVYKEAWNQVQSNQVEAG